MSVAVTYIMSRIISKERKGEFLGGTVQTIPHVTDEIKISIKKAAEKSNSLRPYADQFDPKNKDYNQGALWLNKITVVNTSSNDERNI